jgi:Arc/MetJ-type ribon-helix-helix transcriptional regulator
MVARPDLRRGQGLPRHLGRVAEVTTSIRGGAWGPAIPKRIPEWYTTVVATEQIAVRLPEELLVELDDLVSKGVYESRAAAVRAGIETVMELERRRRTDRAVVEGYRRIPPTAAEREAAIASLREAIAEEPW